MQTIIDPLTLTAKDCLCHMRFAPVFFIQTPWYGMVLLGISVPTDTGTAVQTVDRHCKLSLL